MHDRALPNDVPRKRVQYTWDTQGDCEDDGEVLKNGLVKVLPKTSTFEIPSLFQLAQRMVFEEIIYFVYKFCEHFSV